MKRLLPFLMLLFIVVQSVAQQRINGNFAFQTDPSKDYSIYVPSSYNSAVPNKMMLGLHPLNTARWNGVSWCDTLINFAEANGLLLVCPDGGADGRIDDAIDTAFTTALLDSMRTWYNVDNDRIYAMGFSWGGRTTYTYGLKRPSVFGGFIPIGAAITRTNEVTVPLQLNSNGKPVYIIHGSFDAPQIRFLPVRDSLVSKGAIVNFNYLNGVGHTIDFPNRNTILTTAFNWIDSINNAQLVGLNEITNPTSNDFVIFPNPLKKGQSFQLEITKNIKPQKAFIEIFSIKGKKLVSYNVKVRKGKNKIDKEFSLSSGTYLISIQLLDDNSQTTKELIIN